MKSFIPVVLFSTLCLAALMGGAASGQTRESFEKWFAEYPVQSTNDERYKEFFSKADQAMGNYRFDESITCCEQALRYKPDDFLARAMMCLDYYEIAEALSPKVSAERKKKLDTYHKMVTIAEEGMKFAPDKGECFFMRGLAKARIATTKGIVSSLFMAKGIERDWLEAIKHHSDYVTPKGENLIASCYVALGSYYRLCPTFFLLKLIFGIHGDIDKSVGYCRKAYDLDTTRIEIVKEYGVSLVTRGLKRKNPADIQAGRNYLTLVETLPLRLRTDQVDKDHSKLLLADISLCPDYSRDQQQDISDEAVKKHIAAQPKQALP
jgi:hypothetical protein